MEMKSRRALTANELFDGLRQQDRISLARAITLVESQHPGDHAAAAELITLCLPFAGSATRIGISGAPGAGKSTFIEAYGQLLTAAGNHIAVLAIDPSSGLNKGSILGDKTRMEFLARDPLAFIRPSPAGTTLGGVARKTRETILLCEAAGYDYILIETVGVGQSETAVQAMTDLFLLLLIPGAGDELQGIKRGIVEMADMILVNKADGDRTVLAEEARQHYERAIHLYPSRRSGQAVPIRLISSIEKTGLTDVRQDIDTYLAAIKASGYLNQRRSEQAAYWLRESLMDQLATWVFTRYKSEYAALEQDVLDGKTSPFLAADTLMSRITGKDHQ
jgi:LAO/AO transport system kinase